jgi:hypothetical protein
VYSSERFLSGENTLRRKTIRRTPSAPELAQNRRRPRIESSKRPVARSDPRLDNATTERWGITFISDDVFRKVITSYLVWDHPCWQVFDVDEFCKAVSGHDSELASKLLVTAVLALALVCVSALNILLDCANLFIREYMCISTLEWHTIITLCARRQTVYGKKV